MMMAISPIFDPKQWVLWEVDHIDGITGSNDVSNFRWVLPMTNKESEAVHMCSLMPSKLHVMMLNTVSVQAYFRGNAPDA
jgi:hypothetical protein